MDTIPELSFDNTQVAFAPRSDAALQRMLWIFRFLDRDALARIAMKLANWSVKGRLPFKTLVKNTVFAHFCGGESIEDCAPTIAGLASYGVGSILDYSVEGVRDEAGFDATRDEILRTIQYAAASSHLPFSVFKLSGIGDRRLLARVQKKKPLTPEEDAAFERIRQRLDRLCNAAYQQKVKILVDAEASWFQDVTDQLVLALMEKYNKQGAIVYNTFQMYRKDMFRRLKDAHHEAVAKGFFLGAKLVRGAYLEKELKRARKKGYPSPIHSSKEHTDQDFNDALRFCLNNKQRIFLVSGTHNEGSNIILPELMYLHGMKKNDERVYFAQLFGMSDHITFNLSRAGYNVAKYLPYGPLEAVMPYLSRRAAENKSVSAQSPRTLALIKKELARRKASKTH